MSGNPFLLPPGGAKRVPPAATPDVGPKSASPAAPAAAPDAAPAAGPEHYIAVPASVESATHRIHRPNEPEPAAPSDVAEETVVAPVASPATRSWVLELPDGTRCALAGALLLGRNPAGIADRPDAGLLAVVDPGKTVSKTHALLAPDAGGVRVRDLHSTNGVAIDAAGERRLLSAGGEAVAPPGSTILLGSFAVGVAAG
jgi:hypothetical protein